MDDLYDVSMEMEILRESYAVLIAKLFYVFEKYDINYKEDTDNKWVKLLHKTQKSYHSIMKIRTFAEAEELYKERDTVNVLLQEELNE